MLTDGTTYNMKIHITWLSLWKASVILSFGLGPNVTLWLAWTLIPNASTSVKAYTIVHNNICSTKYNNNDWSYPGNSAKCSTIVVWSYANHAAISRSAWSSATCQYLDFKSRVEKQVTLPRSANMSSISGRGYARGLVMLFRALKSTQKRCSTIFLVYHHYRKTPGRFGTFNHSHFQHLLEHFFD